LRRLGAVSGATSGRGQQGSALLLVLFACLAVAVAIQTLAAVVLCAERAVVDESVGRSRASEKDEGLAIARSQMLAAWLPLPWSTVIEAPSEVQARVSAIEGGLGWVMRVDVRQPPEMSQFVTSAWLERGRDGIDLPLAAMVATRVILDPERVSPWLEVDATALGFGPGPPDSDITARAYLVEPPAAPVSGEDCVVKELGEEWRLDEGWRLLGRSSTAPEPGVLWMSSRPGETVGLPEDRGGQSADAPLLAVVSGGGDLDLRDQGDLYGVVVVDGGALLLEGTVLHGAAFVTGAATLGANGSVRYCRPILRWATDRSLRRVRLVPGSRAEGTE
jgi:hypothetical protein